MQQPEAVQAHRVCIQKTNGAYTTDEQTCWGRQLVLIACYKWHGEDGRNRPNG
jgi:hypothetical protein